MRRTLALVLVLALPVVASAATLKVPQQYETIGEAVQAATAGDTVLVSRGIYSERVSAEGKSGIRIVGKRAVWDGLFEGSPGTCLDILGDDIRVQGFKFRHGGIYIGGDRATVTKCVIRGARADGVEIDGNEATVTKCTMRGCSWGIDVDGADAFVSKNRVLNMDDGGIEMDGDRCDVVRNTIKVVEDGNGIEASGHDSLIARNTVINTDDHAIEVDGDRCVVQRNRITGTSDHGIDVDGNDVLIERNVCSMCDDEGLWVYGDGFRILRNKVSGVFDDSDGMYLSSATEVGGGLVENNLILDAVESGIDFNGNNVTFRRNKVLECGSESDEAFEISGGGNLLEDCQAVSCEGDGFEINGSGNRAVRCKAIDCGLDGFTIYGKDNELIDCLAKDCDAEGLHNDADRTVVDGGIFTGCRIDIACDVEDGATFAKFAPKRYGTGGVDTPPELY